jgi:hypothetical protein
LNGPPSFLFGANTVFRREALEKAGFYDEHFRNNYEDVDLGARLKKSGYALAYESRAIVYHLRQDNPATVLESYWRWHWAYYRQEQFYASPERFRYKLKESLGTANRFLEEDMLSGRRSLVYLDFLLALHHCLKDLKHFMMERRPGDLPEADGISLWLAFVDLIFFCRYDDDAAPVRTLMKPDSALAHNYFALTLILGRYLVDKFPAGNFTELLFRHTIWVFFGVNSPMLADQCLTVVRQRSDWRCLLERSHPYLDKDFLEEFSQTFITYVDRLLLRFPDIGATMETSAKLMRLLF